MEKNISPGKSRRQFVKQGFQAAVAFTIIPRFVMGGKGYLAPSDRITLGFIGTGKQGKILAGYFHKNTDTQIIAGSDVDSKKLAAFHQHVQKQASEKTGQEYKSFSPYPDFRELLQRKDIDAVVIATPDHWHAVQTVMAANAGKHVYCEKPMAHSVGEGRAMVNAVKKNKVAFQTGSMQRSWDKFRNAVDLVRNGYIGQVKEVLVTVGDPAIAFGLPGMPVPEYLNWDAWVGPSVVRPYHTELSPPIEQDVYPHWRNFKEYGGGSLSDWGTHMFDIVQWALDKDRTGPVKFDPPSGNAVKGLTMTYNDGIVMKHVDFGRKYAVRFIGEKGVIDVSREFLDSNPAAIVYTPFSSGDKRVYSTNNHYQDWINSIKTGKPTVADVETGHRTSSVSALANIAYWLRRPLEWDPKNEQFKNDAEANALLTPPVRAPWKLV
jgi:predicted dehydrogenase